MAHPEQTALSPYYYRDNFLRLCDTVEALYRDILTRDELAVLARFRALGFSAQCLFVRLVSRAGPWFRESKLVYPELGAVTPALDELLDSGMATQADSLSLQDAGKLFTRAELAQAFAAALAGCRFPTKAALMGAIEDLGVAESLLPQAMNRVDRGRLIAPLGVELVAHLQILFFGNRHQSLTEFVLEDLGVVRYFNYPLDREHRLFSCREAFEEYLACAALSDGYRTLQEQGEHDLLPALAEQVLNREIRFPSSENRWHRLCNRLARELERREHWDLALRLYTGSSAHPARERRARILERRGDWLAADRLCNEILLDPWCEPEREAALRIQPRVQRKLGGRPGSQRRDRFDQLSLCLPAGGESVEEIAATHLRSQWQAVRYVENSLMTTLFGLAFWEVIFAPVPGAFHNPYQRAPADMYEQTFRTRRRQAIAARWQELRAGDLPQLLEEAYQRYWPCECQWVDWRRIDAALVSAAARVIPAAHLLAIWERILFDPQENRRGFPDLIALGAKPGEYCLIEVKGPGDALQDSQKRWLRFFRVQQIPAQVAWVEWAT